MNANASANGSSRTAALLLAASFMVAIITLTLVNKLTEQKISQTREQWLLENISAVLPQGPFDNNPVVSKKIYTLNATGTAAKVVVYPAYLNDKPAAAALELLAPEGYSGDIKLLIGLQTDGSIIGVRVIEHQETPGLGDNIEYLKSPWITQFDTQSLESIADENWQLSRRGGDFDGLTGATVTSIAVVRTVHQALKWFKRNKLQIFDQDIRS